MISHEIPGRSLRQYFGSPIRIELTVGRVRPYGFVAGTVRTMRWAGGGSGRRHHDAFDTRLRRGAKHPQRSVTRRHDQFVGIPG
jgi:hypothetical protein